MSTNPLSKYFRQPSIYVKLPSDGRFWPESDLVMPENRELPIYPMTTKDEVTLKTPDALMNGAGVVSIIQSCCPNIVNAWNMPSIDLDLVLIAIRIASYGHSMDFTAKCPHCTEDNENAIDLRTLIDRVQCPDYSNKLVYNDLKIKLKPQSYFANNRGKSIRFEEQKLMQALANVDLSDEVRNAEIAKSMEKIIQLGIDTITSSTEYIELEDGTVVTDPAHINEFYNNTKGDLSRLIQEELSSVSQRAGLQPIALKCTGCEKEFSVPLEFDYANFFGKGF